MSPLSLISHRPRGHGQLVGTSLFALCCCGSGNSPERWQQQRWCLTARRRQRLLARAPVRSGGCWSPARRQLACVPVRGDGAAATAQLPVRHLHQHENVIQNPAFVDFSPSTWTGAAQVVPHGGAAGAAQLRLRRAARLLRPYGKPVRGHCIFWAVENTLQQWVKRLDGLCGGD